MSPRFLLIVCLMLVLAATERGAAQNGSAMTSDTATEAYEPLKDSFRALATSLTNTGGLRQSQRAVVERFEQRVAEFVQQWPDFQPAIAMQLQLAMWLKNDTRADELFGALTELRPESLDLARAWMKYLRSREMSERLDAVAATLRARFPNDPAFELVVIEQLRDENQYPEALGAMEALEYDSEQTPEAAVLHSELLFAEHRFAEALEKLESLPATARATSEAARTAFAVELPIRRNYVGFWETESQIRQLETDADDLPRVLIVTDRGSIVVELFENDAPNTVANFISLVETSFYDETQFHRVELTALIQGGDPNTKPDGEGTPGTGGPAYTIADEYGLPDARRHFSGSLAMAHTGTPNSAGSQFYFTVTPNAQFNGRYTVFGRVIEGLDVVRAIRKGDRITATTVLRKRDHEYTPQTIAAEAPGVAGPTPEPTIDVIDPGTVPPPTTGDTGGDAGTAGDANTGGGGDAGAGGGDAGGSGDAGSGGDGNTGGGGGARL